MTLDPGTQLGRYSIRSLLGSGGMGEVYLAYDRDLERDVAIKVLHDGDDASGDRGRRFVQEAKAASALHHPNIAHVYEIGSHDDIRFIAMEIVVGETLRDRIARGSMPVDEAIDIAKQIAAALAAAHKHGVIHRDVKPENVIIGKDGYAKVLDFGLAKLREIRGEDAATLLKTAPGVAMGTLPYMAPEQIAGEDVTAAADVFSLGVVMYEMLAGRRPFAGASASELAGAILSKSPQSLREIRRDIPAPLTSIITKCLAKKPEARYSDASQVLDDLGKLSTGPRPAKSNLKVIIGIAAAVIVVALLASAASMMHVRRQRRAALDKLALAERLVGEKKLAEAFDIVTSVSNVLPDDDRVRTLLTQTSDRLKIESEPPGATVFAQRFKGPATRVRLGLTPLTVPRIARSDYLFTLEKPGYATLTGAVSLVPFYYRGEAMLRDTPPVQFQMAESSKVPAGMVLVPGGDYRLSAAYRPSDRVVTLRDFFIDRCEVSNRDFNQFVRGGGYRRPELWKHPFVDHGKTLTFAEAMARFHDTTGVPAPRGWSGGAPPSGREDYPVTDVTWYEAAAFAEWKGKALPSIYQWEKAARYPVRSPESAFPWGPAGEGVDVTERANFLGAGTMPVDSMPFGASPYGALHMAGNVSEWCRNEDPPGYAARGGSFRDALYAFGQTAALPGFYSAPTLGFRCVKSSGGDEGAFALTPSGFVPVYTPVNDKTFEEYRRRFDYAKTPLGAHVIERVETSDWTREKIAYTVGAKRVIAYLYLPRGFRRPLQVIHFFPAGDVTAGRRTLAHSIEINLAPFIRAGRAVFSVELEGFLGRPRPADWIMPDGSTTEFVEEMVADVTEIRRGLDYLETRPEIDRTRIALMGVSAGGGTGVFASALESRYRSVVFEGTGINVREKDYAPAASRINFVSRIKGPTLMLNGRYDEDCALKSEAEPMFRLLHEPKRLETYEGGHVAPQEIGVPAVTKWLDETMGKI